MTEAFVMSRQHLTLKDDWKWKNACFDMNSAQWSISHQVPHKHDGTRCERICDKVASQPLPLWCWQVVEKHTDSSHETGEACRSGAGAVAGARAWGSSRGARGFCLRHITQPVWVVQLQLRGGCWRGGRLRWSCFLCCSAVIVSVSQVQGKWLRSFR